MGLPLYAALCVGIGQELEPRRCRNRVSFFPLLLTCSLIPPLAPLLPPLAPLPPVCRILLELLMPAPSPRAGRREAHLPRDLQDSLF